MLVAILKKEGHPSIDNEQIDKSGRQVFGFAGRGTVKLIVVGPIVGGSHIKKLLQLGSRRRFSR